MDMQHSLNRSGKRYQCVECGKEVLVVIEGRSQMRPLTCHGKAMVLQPPPRWIPRDDLSTDQESSLP
jgi:hypothetical protein